jgi:hypothetical protein
MSSDPSEQQFVWTFIIRKGQSFHLGRVMTPRLDHDGRHTLWKMVGTEMEAAEISDAIRTISGAEVSYHTEKQSEEMLELRGQLPE